MGREETTEAAPLAEEPIGVTEKVLLGVNNTEKGPGKVPEKSPHSESWSSTMPDFRRLDRGPDREDPADPTREDAASPGARGGIFCISRISRSSVAEAPSKNSLSEPPRWWWSPKPRPFKGEVMLSISRAVEESLALRGCCNCSPPAAACWSKTRDEEMLPPHKSPPRSKRDTVADTATVCGFSQNTYEVVQTFF